MISKKPKEQFDEFCKLYDYDREDTELIVNEFYTEIREKMESMEHDNLLIPKMGHFFLKVWTIKRTINKLKAVLEIEENKKKKKPYGETSKLLLKKLEKVYKRMTDLHDKKIKSKIAGWTKLHKAKGKVTKWEKLHDTEGKIGEGLEEQGTNS